MKLNVERYGGMILSTWFDRPLSVAGRMIIRKNGKILEKLVKIDRVSGYDPKPCHPYEPGY